MTPTPEELNGFWQSCARRGFQTENSRAGRLPIVRLPELGITVGPGGIGKAQFAVQTQYLLDTGADWDLVICAGTAGGLVDELSIGDVVVATLTMEHDYNNKFSARPKPSFEAAQDIIADLRRVCCSSNSFKVHFGTVASGDEDVIDPNRRRMLYAATGALVVAWEGAGGARACAFSNTPFIEIRGVTDAANQQAPSDFETNLEVAMNNVATLVTSWISPESHFD